jgi:hypothetical protein
LNKPAVVREARSVAEAPWAGVAGATSSVSVGA